MATYQTKLFINNEYVPSKANKTLPVYNPVDNSFITDVHEAGESDIDDAVAAARAAFESGPWSTMGKQERAKIMLKFADLVEAELPELSKLHTICMGQPLQFAILFSQQLPAMFRYYAGYIDKISGETHTPDGDGCFKIVSYEPYGVCAGIASWNAAYFNEGMKIAPALAAGNTAIFKPSEKSPLACLALGRLVIEAGFPPGVINLVTGAGTTGSLMSSHMGIQKLSFTGTAHVGRLIQIAAAKSNFKSVALELSGKSAALVFDDADLPLAIAHCSQEMLLNTGQICAATSKLLVHESIAPKFIEGVKQAFKDLGGPAMGDPMDKNTFLGPLADQKHFDMVMGYINGAKKEGIELLAGGERKGTEGNFLLPTLFMNPGANSKIWKEDMFGPVAMITTFKDEDEALKLANDTEYGLSGRIYTSSYSRALRVGRRLQVGACGINGAAIPHYSWPFGGWKLSGHGKEGGLLGLKEYLQVKTLVFNGV